MIFNYWLQKQIKQPI